MRTSRGPTGQEWGDNAGHYYKMGTKLAEIKLGHVEKYSYLFFPAIQARLKQGGETRKTKSSPQVQKGT